MKASDLRAKDAAGLEKEVAELLKAHFGLRMQKATQQLSNHTQLGNGYAQPGDQIHPFEPERSIQVYSLYRFRDSRSSPSTQRS